MILCFSHEPMLLITRCRAGTDQQKPIQFAGEKVKVTGTYDKVTGTIHVVNIESGSQRPCTGAGPLWFAKSPSAPKMARFFFATA
jgi:hypothetical protein